MQYTDRLEQAEERYNVLTDQMANPVIINDPDQYRKTAKAQSELMELVSKYREWKKAEQELRDARAMLSESDPDLRQMAEMEVVRLEPEVQALERDLEIL